MNARLHASPTHPDHTDRTSHGAGARMRGIRAVHDATPMYDDPRRQAAAVFPHGQWQAHDPFLSMMNDRFARDVFAPHPHRGFETVTYVLDGTLQHRDSRGGNGVLHPGDLQWMTAGSGVLHDEQPGSDGMVHVLQLWLNLPAADKLATPHYQDLRGAQMPVRREPGVEARVFSGTSGDVRGPAQNHVPVTLVDFRITPGHAVEQAVTAGDNGFVFVVSGEARLGRDGTHVHAGQSAWLERGADGDRGETTLRIENTGDAPLHALLFAGTPLREPVVAQGPFVMNSQQDIVRAINDYNAGTFGRMDQTSLR